MVMIAIAEILITAIILHNKDEDDDTNCSNESDSPATA